MDTPLGSFLSTLALFAIAIVVVRVFAHLGRKRREKK